MKYVSRAVALAMALLLAAGVHAAPKQTERSKQKAAAETTRAGIAQKLARLKQEISRTESQKEDVADDLADSEEAISNANRSLRELAEEQGATNLKVGELSASREQLAATVDAQKAQLSRLLREHYLAGNEDRIKLLLSGDNPNRINRDLQMMAYVSQAQARLLASLRRNLAAVEQNQLQAQNARDELEEIAQEERDQKAVLVKEKARRAALLGNLSSRLTAQRKEVGNLERDEQRMSALVDRLSLLLKEQADAAAAEKRRLEARAKARADAQAVAARAKAERERQAREAAQAGKTPVPTPAEEIPVAQHVPEPDPEQAKPETIALAPAAPAGAFAGLKGQLRAPVAGKLVARFGAKRGGGPTWKGVFIQAAEGADVKVVAAGRVVFAGYMRGFGNLIVVDHGGTYWSTYGNNQAVLKRAGDVVRGGDSIAIAGNTGSIEESGLYFELRHGGKAFDPAGWIHF
jgi:septal ring factor EnvC (AmiA/AmiB activator)